VAVIDGVTNGDPVESATPPVKAAYHFKVPPPPAVAAKETIPVPQRLFGVVPATVGLIIRNVSEAVVTAPQASVTVTIYIESVEIVPDEIEIVVAPPADQL